MICHTPQLAKFWDWPALSSGQICDQQTGKTLVKFTGKKGSWKWWIDNRIIESIAKESP